MAVSTKLAEKYGMDQRLVGQYVFLTGHYNYAMEIEAYTMDVHIEACKGWEIVSVTIYGHDLNQKYLVVLKEKAK